MNGHADLDQSVDLTDWQHLDIVEFRRIYEAAIAGRGSAANWAQLEARIAAPEPKAAEREILQHAYQEALRAGRPVLVKLTLDVARALLDIGIDTAVAERIIERLSREQIGGHLQAIVQGGGFKTRETLDGAIALHDATAMVYMGKRVVGTAFLVARDLVITAAHVALKHDKDAFLPHLADDLSFSFRVFESKARRESVIARPAATNPLVASSLPWGRPPKHLYVSPVDAAGSLLDFALIRLDCAIVHVDPVDIGTPEAPQANGPLLVLGFPGGTAMGWDAGVVHEASRVRLMHKVNTLGGMSGSACLNVDGKPVAMHEGSLDDRTYSIGGHDQPQNLNRAICLAEIRSAMCRHGKDPLAGAQVSPGIAIYSDLLVAQWAKSGLRLAPAASRGKWSQYVKAAIGVWPDSQGPFPAFHPWFSRPPFEEWIDHATNSKERLCIVNGSPGSGKSFLIEILRAKLADAARDVVHISATETTAWSWSEAIQKWGVESAAPDSLRPSAGVVGHDEIPQAAARIASYGGRSPDASAKPLFVVIDFDGSASFPPGEEIPWQPFMADLLGNSWVRLVVLGAPISITQDLADDSGDDDLLVNQIDLQHFNHQEFDAFARHYMQHAGATAVTEAQLKEAALRYADIVAAFPAVELQTVATVLAAILLQQFIEEQ